MFEVDSLSFTEQVVAADAVYLGYHVAYVPEAEVLVSKKVSITGSFREAFDYGVLLKKHIQSFGLYVIDEHSYDVIRKNMEQVYREQYRYAKKEVLSKGNVFAVPCLRLIQSANKWGNKLGKRYHRLPDKLNRAFSNTKEYWA